MFAPALGMLTAVWLLMAPGPGMVSFVHSGQSAAVA